VADVLEFTILGCGSSGGVPRADGNWGACDPDDPRNRRSRCSLLVRRKNDVGPESWTTILIDTSPDLQRQTSGAGARRLDAVLLTHDHADQVHGIDDVRAFAINQHSRIPCYMDEATAATMRRRFSYIFKGEGGYPAICDPMDMPPLGAPWRVDGPSGPIPILAFDQDHGGVRSLGFRFGDVGYCSDVVRLPNSAMEALAGVEVLIVDALRYRPHPTHATVDQALVWIAALKPKRGILTNMHIDLDYATLAAELPEGVEPAYDGLRFTIAMLDL
jgi:phosphoribosyl 1,2-cyclic phosphate phosphodiesterase